MVRTRTPLAVSPPFTLRTSSANPHIDVQHSAQGHAGYATIVILVVQPCSLCRWFKLLQRAGGCLPAPISEETNKHFLQWRQRRLELVHHALPAPPSVSAGRLYGMWCTSVDGSAAPRHSSAMACPACTSPAADAAFAASASAIASAVCAAATAAAATAPPASGSGATSASSLPSHCAAREAFLCISGSKVLMGFSVSVSFSCEPAASEARGGEGTRHDEAAAGRGRGAGAVCAQAERALRAHARSAGRSW